MTTLTQTVASGPRMLLARLLMHQGESLATLAHHLIQPVEQVERSVARLARRGLIEATEHGVAIATHRRAAVADYAEGAISLRDLVGAR